MKNIINNAKQGFFKLYNTLYFYFPHFVKMKRFFVYIYLRFFNLIYHSSLVFKNNIYNIISIFVLVIIFVIFCFDISLSDLLIAIKNTTSSAASLIPFLSPKFNKVNFNYKYILFLTIIILLNPFKIMDFILSLYSFKLLLLILVIIYILLITWSVLNLLLLYLFSNAIINLKHYESSSNYFIKLLLNKQSISKSNNINIYIRIYKVNTIVYTILLLFVITLLFLGIE